VPVFEVTGANSPGAGKASTAGVVTTVEVFVLVVVVIDVMPNVPKELPEFTKPPPKAKGLTVVIPVPANGVDVEVAPTSGVEVDVTVENAGVDDTGVNITGVEDVRDVKVAEAVPVESVVSVAESDVDC
jgi:hypothetical protein